MNPGLILFMLGKHSGLCPSLKGQPISVLGVDTARILGTDLPRGECSSCGPVATAGSCLVLAAAAECS